MHEYVSLLDQILRWAGILTEFLILFFLFWVPVAKDLWMLRLYLCCSLISTAPLVFIEYHFSLNAYVLAYQAASIICYVLILLIAVELMAALVTEHNHSVAPFYALAVTALLLAALSELRFPFKLSMSEFMIFAAKSVALTMFIMAVTLALSKKYRWPYSGLANGLTAMMALNLLSIIGRNWSAAHDWQYYNLVRYSFPLASDIGYLLWFRAIFVHHEKPPKPPMSPEKIAEWREQLVGYKAAIKDSIKKRTAQ